MLGHWLLGRGLWVRGFRPSRRVARAVGALCVAMAVVYSFAYPWAAPMFVGLLAATAWVLRRHARDADGPNLFAQLDGTVAPGSLVPLAALPVAATATYAGWTALEPSEALIRGVFLYGTIGVQTLVAGVAMVWSIVVVLRRSNRRLAQSVAA